MARAEGGGEEEGGDPSPPAEEEEEEDLPSRDAEEEKGFLMPVLARRPSLPS